MAEASPAMSGSISGSSGNDGYLLALFSSGGTGGGSSIDPISALTIAEKTQTSAVATEAQQPQVMRDLAAFRTAVAKAKTPQDLLNNPTALKVLLTANGLGDQAAYPALAVKALTSNPADSNALVNQLSDTRWKSVAQTYEFATKGLSILNQPQALATIANGYAEVLWRNSLDQQTPGLSNALTFRQEASTIKSVNQILGDPIMRTVVTTALGVPKEIALQDLGAQGLAITSRLDITKFKDPSFVDRFTQRYLIAAGQNAAQQRTAPSLTDLAVQATGLVI